MRQNQQDWWHDGGLVIGLIVVQRLPYAGVAPLDQNGSKWSRLLTPPDVLTDRLINKTSTEASPHFWEYKHRLISLERTFRDCINKFKYFKRFLLCLLLMYNFELCNNFITVITLIPFEIVGPPNKANNSFTLSHGIQSTSSGRLSSPSLTSSC